MTIGLERREGVRRLLMGMVALVAGGAFWGACGETANTDVPVYLTCADAEDCHIAPNVAVGTICVENRCVCELPGECLCFKRGVPHNVKRCMPLDECEVGANCTVTVPGTASSSGQGGSGGTTNTSAGGAGGEVIEPECTTEADCPQVPDARCGYATCIDGMCGMDLLAQPGELRAIKSQLRGDCQSVVCDGTGHTLTVDDAADLYDDAKLCTIDMCGADGPMHLMLEDGSPCPGGGSGWCYGGKCVPCISTITGATQDCGPGQFCGGLDCYSTGCLGACGKNCSPCQAGYACKTGEDCADGVCGLSGMCELPSCNDGQKNDGETGPDCGGPTCNNPCLAGQGCEIPADCASGVCWAGVCEAPTCTDGVMNGDEADIDCGGICDACIVNEP